MITGNGAVAINPSSDFDSVFGDISPAIEYNDSYITNQHPDASAGQTEGFASGIESAKTYTSSSSSFQLMKRGTSTVQSGKGRRLVPKNLDTKYTSDELQVIRRHKLQRATLISTQAGTKKEGLLLVVDEFFLQNGFLRHGNVFTLSTRIQLLKPFDKLG
jgi:hypothetical protein